MTILVVGALHWDVVVRAPRLPHIDETLRGSSVAYQFGGKGGNQAIAAARAGADVAFAGRIGSDQAGAEMKRRLTEAGIDVSGLQAGPDASGMSAAIVDEDGNYGAVIVSAENHKFDADLMSLPGGCQMVLLQNEMTHAVLRQVKQKAVDAGVPIVFNAAPAPGLTGEDLQSVDVLIVNRLEASDLLGHDPLDTDWAGSVRRLQTLVPGSAIIVTLGGDGVCSARSGQAPRHQPAKKAVVRSTHGAGDVFVGAFAAAYADDAPFETAIEKAQTAAAEHVSGNR
ncbi:PfkB family carbohydrate kinase [uncultured Roseibium sp.]|uniref:PfkB family carbohydrate kinase n=1 Tax=uncultured Roseibium sp. TaxID=1936171 RepID=UPI00263578D4|nr:PfkB family carbohydrate kinase [uncultured Roseibium sp.]